MIFSANMFGPGFDSRQLHKAPMRDCAKYGLINDRHTILLGLTGFDGMTMVKGGDSGHINGKLVSMFNRQLERAAA